MLQATHDRMSPTGRSNYRKEKYVTNQPVGTMDVSKLTFYSQNDGGKKDMEGRLGERLRGVDHGLLYFHRRSFFYLGVLFLFLALCFLSQRYIAQL